MSSEMGMAIISANPDTHRVPIRKGKKPNWFFMGFHSLAESNSHNECSCRMGAALRYKPMPIATTSNRLLTVRINIR